MKLKTVYGPPPEDQERIEANESDLISEISEETQVVIEKVDASSTTTKKKF
ncbi:MAG: hypothetical protein ABFC57_05725 [Veillonellales bacterium]